MITPLDDYNFLVQRYNLCGRFFALVDSMSIPKEAAAKLKKEYAEQIIRSGRNMDFVAGKERRERDYGDHNGERGL